MVSVAMRRTLFPSTSKQALDSLRAIERSLLMLAEGKERDHFDAGFDMNYSWDFLDSLRDVFVKDAPAQELFADQKSQDDSQSEKAPGQNRR